MGIIWVVNSLCYRYDLVEILRYQGKTMDTVLILTVVGTVAGVVSAAYPIVQSSRKKRETQSKENSPSTPTPATTPSPKREKPVAVQSPAKNIVQTSGAVVFSDSDAAYEKWVKENPTGFVINTSRTLDSNYMPVHRATCAHITNFDKRTSGAFTERDLIKICALDITPLQEWVKVNGRPDGTFTGNCPCLKK
jgi:hypothetical protein